MKKLTLILAATISTIFLQAQTRNLQEVLTLKMPLTVDDDMPGTRGANVVWHPVQKKYYAAFAGNMGYPLAVFDAKGIRLSDDTLVCREDVRGLWYNPDTKAIQGNAYNDYGWFTYVLNTSGIPVDHKTLIEGMNQPDAQSVGAYNYRDKKVLFIFEDQLNVYDIEDATPSFVTDIAFGKTGASNAGDLAEYNAEDYNYTSLVYTGTSKAEVGFLNVSKKQIELYDITTGYLTKVLVLPDTAPAEVSFNFAYANGIYWLFDMKGRVWHGYK